MGLALVKEIVTAHGGRATVDNAEPGAVFTIVLPLSLRFLQTGTATMAE